jgi:hypothetical protein
MRLSAIFLNDLATVNNYRESEHLEMTAGDAVTVYIQLRDASVQTVMEGYKNPGRRYVPVAFGGLTPPPVTLEVKIDTMDDAKAILLTKLATQPFPTTDPSIWMFTILNTDPVTGTRRLKLKLTDATGTINGVVNSAILVTPA